MLSLDPHSRISSPKQTALVMPNTSVVPCQYPADLGRPRFSKLPKSVTDRPSGRSSTKPIPRKIRVVQPLPWDTVAPPSAALRLFRANRHHSCDGQLLAAAALVAVAVGAVGAAGAAGAAAAAASALAAAECCCSRPTSFCTGCSLALLCMGSTENDGTNEQATNCRLETQVRCRRIFCEGNDRPR